MAEKIPPPTLPDVLSRLFTRLDLLLEYFAREEERKSKTEAEMLDALNRIAVAVGAPPVMIPLVEIPAVPPIKIPPPITLIQEVKNTGYKNFELDLTKKRDREKLGLQDANIIADTMTIIRADSPFEYRLNDPKNDPTPAEKGMHEDEFVIEEVYITNAAATGKAIIRTNWNPKLIRLPNPR